jgi:thiol:disulfide interchange protein DsbD
MKRLLLALLLLPTALAWSQDDDLLEPDAAFTLQEPVVTADKVTLKWKIAPGYYLYQNKFSFELKGGASRLDKPQMPEAISKQDDFFGEVQIYKKFVSVDLPVVRTGNDAESLILKTVFQGCNEPIGVCYPPITKEIKLDLPAVAEAKPKQGAFISSATDTSAAKTSAPETRSGLASLLEPGAGEDEFLPPDEAFQLILGRTEVYHVNFSIDLALAGQSADGQFQLIAKYQGCAEKGICYPPISKTVNLALADGSGSSASSATTELQKSIPVESSSKLDGPAEVSEEEGVIAMLSQGSIGTVIIGFFLFGLALSLTPCVFPMIPILSGIIVGHGADVSRKKAFMLSVVYVAGMAIMYTIAGMLAGLTGELLSSAFQNPWVLGGSALVFVLLSFSMFGFYELQLPAKLQGKLAQTSNSMPGGAYSGVFVMGALSALIIGPCVAAPLSGALLYIGQSGDFVLGGIALFVMSLGMGVPLLLIGASAGSLLPKAGLWMNAVKAVFGVLMLAVAIWLLERILPHAVTLALWAMLLIVSAIYMRAVDALPDTASGWQRFWKGIGIVVLLYGLAIFVGSLTGATDVLNPLEKITGSTQYINTGAGSGNTEGEASFENIKSLAELDAALAKAASEEKPVFVDFFADWCVECVRMENTTFKAPTVVEAFASFKLIRLDVTENDDANKAALKKFNLFGPPAMMFFDLDGKEIRHLRVIGYQDAAEFTATLKKAAKTASVK